jgi:hypothetical protein
MCVLLPSCLLRCSASNKNHYVHYDDGEERWYQLTARQYSVLPELGEEVVGRKIAVEVTSRRWYVASIKAFEPDLHVHHFVYDDFPGEEEYADINSRYVSTICPFLICVCVYLMWGWGCCRNFEWLVDATQMTAGERILGRRINVYWSRPASFYPATITEYTPSAAVEGVMTTPSGTKMLPLSSSIHGTPATPLLAPSGSGMETSAMGLSLLGASGVGVHGRGALGRQPSYVAVAITPDADATIKLVYDDGDKQMKRLGEIRFIWLEDRIVGKPVAKGVVGLLNMGNTCYLNSILQCLTHIEPLTAYCMDDSFHALINSKNSSGMGGRMALAFAELLTDLSGQSATAVAPGFIKALLSEKNALFNGMGQQDAHEALMCLLDAVHEDLSVPDHAATAAAVDDARIAAEEEEKERRAASKPSRAFARVDTVKMDGVPSAWPGTTVSPTAALVSALAPTPLNDGAAPQGFNNPAGLSMLSPVGAAHNAQLSILPSPVDNLSPASTATRESPAGSAIGTMPSNLSAEHDAAAAPPSHPAIGLEPLNEVGDVQLEEAVLSPQSRRTPSETTSIIKQLFFIHMHVQFLCNKHKHMQIRHGPRGGEMLPPLPVAGKRESRVGLFPTPHSA